jgi:RsiW-degrading membrane proteinase PrsW (M82 family)
MSAKLILPALVALLPVLCFLAALLYLDSYKLVKLQTVIAVVACGAGVAGAGFFLNAWLLGLLGIELTSYTRYVGPVTEELLKGLVIVVLIRLHRIGFLVDAAIFGFAVGSGFAVIENLYYLEQVPDAGMGTWIVRGFGTAIMHGTTLGVLAAIAHEFAERETREAAADFNFNLLWFVPGYGVAVALHMAFNQFPNRPMLAMLGSVVVAPLVLIGILNFGTSEAQSWLAAECDEHRRQVEILRSGRWPQGPAGQKIGALAGRFDAETAKRIRRYWELQAWLVAEAEETMMEEAAGDAEFDPAQIRAAIAELDGLRKALGRSTFAALQALLPFSRNDLWEVSELKQRLSHR